MTPQFFFPDLDVYGCYTRTQGLDNDMYWIFEADQGEYEIVGQGEDYMDALRSVGRWTDNRIRQSINRRVRCDS